MSDRTFEFCKELARILTLPKRVMLSDHEIASLITDAQAAHGANRPDWHRLEMILGERTEWKEPQMKAEMRRCRVLADLKVDPASYPYVLEDAFPLWLSGRGYSMSYVGKFLQRGIERSVHYVLTRFTMWAKEMRTGDADEAKRVIDTWIEDRKVEMLKEKFEEIRHDPTADPNKSEIRRFCKLFVNPESEHYERDLIVAEFVIENFIHRVKNHLGAMVGIRVTRPNRRGMMTDMERWTHGSHVMPVFYSPDQGKGKTLSIEKLVEPLKDFHSDADFGVVGDTRPR